MSIPPPARMPVTASDPGETFNMTGNRNQDLMTLGQFFGWDEEIPAEVVRARAAGLLTSYLSQHLHSLPEPRREIKRRLCESPLQVFARKASPSCSPSEADHALDIFAIHGLLEKDYKEAFKRLKRRVASPDSFEAHSFRPMALPKPSPTGKVPSMDLKRFLPFDATGTFREVMDLDGERRALPTSYTTRGLASSAEAGGATGIVYIVRDAGRRDAAVKVLRPNMIRLGADLCFEREAFFGVECRLPNAAEVLRIGRTRVYFEEKDLEREVPFSAMIYYPSNLAHLISQVNELPIGSEQRFNMVLLMVGLFMDLTEAIAKIHDAELPEEFHYPGTPDGATIKGARGVIHRDLKPENVFLTRAAVVKDMVADEAKRDEFMERVAVRVADFGMSCLRFPAMQEGWKGTLGFTSPEFDSIHERAVDLRSDVFSLGAILYYILTGQPPYPVPAEWSQPSSGTPISLEPKDMIEQMRQRMLMPPTHPSKVISNLPPRLGDIAMKALSYDPDKRYQNAWEMLIALGTYEAQDMVVEAIKAFKGDGDERRRGEGGQDTDTALELLGTLERKEDPKARAKSLLHKAIVILKNFAQRIPKIVKDQYNLYPILDNQVTAIMHVFQEETGVPLASPESFEAMLNEGVAHDPDSPILAAIRRRKDREKAGSTKADNDEPKIPVQLAPMTFGPLKPSPEEPQATPWIMLRRHRPDPIGGPTVPFGQRIQLDLEPGVYDYSVSLDEGGDPFARGFLQVFPNGQVSPFRQETPLSDSAVPVFLSPRRLRRAG